MTAASTRARPALLPAVSPGWEQRWHRGYQRWRHRDETTRFNPDRYAVIPLPESPARTFVETHHYLPGWPASRMQFGLIDHAATERRHSTLGQTAAPKLAGHAGDITGLVGVVVLAVPMHKQVLLNLFPRNAPFAETLDLSRLILLDEVPANGESWFCARAFRLAAERGIRGLVAFSDPAAHRRITPSGIAVFSPGHHGGVYQALSAHYTGTTTARTVVELPDGTTLRERSISKIRRQEPGHRGIERRLAYLGALPRNAGQPPGTWLNEQLIRIGANRVKQPGKYRYAFRLGLTPRERGRITLAVQPQPYPKPDWGPDNGH